MESVDAIAQKLIPCTCGGYGENNRRHMSDCPRHGIAWEDIAATLRAERAKLEKFAAFAGPDGEPRKVLGTLPVTADGYIACQDSVVWHPTNGACYPVPDGLNVAAKVYGGAALVPVASCYSTRQAATSALAAQTTTDAGVKP
jgi:hypothetical protein